MANAFSHLISRHIEEGRGDAVAFIEGERRATFADLNRLSAQAAGLLIEAGVGSGDRVLTFAGDSVELVALILGALRIGAVIVVGNHLLPAAKLRFFCADTEARVVLVSALTAPALVADPSLSFQRLWYAGAGDVPVGASRFEEAMAAASPHAAIADVPPEHAACWQYTHGRQGEELAVIHTHEAFIKGSEPFARGRLGLRPDDVCFSMAKLYFGYGFGNTIVFPLSVGASALLYTGRPDVHSVLELVQNQRPTIFFGVPTFYQTMLKIPSCAERYDLSSVRIFVSAGEELGAPLAQRFHETFGTWLVDGIGSTEMFHIFLSGVPGRTRPGVLGTPTPGHEVRLLGPHGEPVAEGEVGDLWVRGPHNGVGYARHPGHAQAVFVDGWIKTGDRMVRDATGEYLYRGRIDDILMVGGQKVILDEIRQCLLEIEHIEDAQVEASYDEERICRLLARVRLRESAQNAQKDQVSIPFLRAYLRERLLPHNWPSKIEIEGRAPAPRSSA